MTVKRRYATMSEKGSGRTDGRVKDKTVIALVCHETSMKTVRTPELKSQRRDTAEHFWYSKHWMKAEGIKKKRKNN